MFSIFDENKSDTLVLVAKIAKGNIFNFLLSPETIFKAYFYLCLFLNVGTVSSSISKFINWIHKIKPN